MDDNTMKLVQMLIDAQAIIAKHEQEKKELIKLLWTAEMNDAKDAEKYGHRYNESLDKTTVNACAVREIFGIMPNPQAVEIYQKYDKEDE